MSLAIPSGYFVDDHIVFGDLSKGSVIARGIECEFPDLSASDDDHLLYLENDIRLMLGCLKPDERLQLEFTTSSDFSTALDSFDSKTNRDSSFPEISRKVRNQLVEHYRARVAAERLIRTNVRFYVSTKLSKWKSDAPSFVGTFGVHKRSIEQHARFYQTLLSGYGGSVKLMNNDDHRRALTDFWSPGQARSAPIEGEVDWTRTIDELCRFSDIAPRNAFEEGFSLDGYKFGVWVFKTFPRSTWMLTMNSFLSLTIPNLRVVVNMHPLGIEEEIQHEEERYGKLMSNIDPQHPSLESEVGLSKHRDRMRNLLSNKVIPFEAQIVAIVYDKTQKGLDDKMQAVRAAIGKTSSEPYLPLVPVSAISFFGCATPGLGPWSVYRPYWHRIDDAYLCNLLPVGSTPCADLADADWIADGDVNNLIGGKNSTGSSPNHLLVCAATNAGKSSWVQTMLVQSAAKSGLIVVIDDGLSYTSTLRAIDPKCRPILIRSNGEQTFNIFGTDGNILTPRHLMSATALCHLLVGKHSDQDKDKLREALLHESIQALYRSSFDSWRAKQPRQYFEACQIAAAMLQEKQELESADDLEDAFRAVRASEKELPGEAEVFAVIGDEAKHSIVRKIAFALWTPKQFPTLSHLQDELSAQSHVGKHKEMSATLASLLDSWLRDGRYGPVVDGASNVDLGTQFVKKGDPPRVIYFELGKMGEAEAELKAVVGFLITNQVRNHIMGMPRDIFKQVVIEEMTGFLEMPSGSKITIDFYERMRKYFCQVISVFQQYGTLFERYPDVAKAIVGNSKCMCLMRNQNTQDLKTLSKFVQLPEVIQKKIHSFPEPTSLRREDAYAGFVWAQLSGIEPKFTVGRNYQSEELHDLTSSAGADFEAKRQKEKEQKAA